MLDEAERRRPSYERLHQPGSESFTPADAYSRMFASDFGSKAVNMVGNEGLTLSIINAYALESLVVQAEKAVPDGRILLLRDAGDRPVLLMLDPSLPVDEPALRVTDGVPLDVPAILADAEHLLAIAAGGANAEHFTGTPHQREVARQLLSGGSSALSEALWIAQPEVLRAPLPEMIPLGCVDPALEVRCGDNSSSVGFFCRDAKGNVGVTACLHGTGPTGTDLLLGGLPAKVSAHSEVQDLVFIRLPDGYQLPAFGHGKGGIRRDRAPSPEEEVHFVGCKSGAKKTQISATSRGLLFIDPRRQSTIETPAVVNRGDSGCALLDRDDKVLGFAFRRTGYGAAIEFADWIWAANAMAALELEPL